jgi:uncharacterized RDD family membrane protein YckC
MYAVPGIVLLILYGVSRPDSYGYYSQGESAGSVFFLILFLLWSIAAGVFFAVQVGQSGQSPGMRLTGVKCLGDRSGQPIGVGMAFLRVVNYLVPFSIGLLWPLWDEKRQTLGDKAAGSVVVAVPKEAFSLVAGFRADTVVGEDDRPLRKTPAEAYPMPPSAQAQPPGARPETVPPPYAPSPPQNGLGVVPDHMPSEPDTMRREDNRVFCRSCGKPNAPSKSFCTGCGFALSTGPSVG